MDKSFMSQLRTGTLDNILEVQVPPSVPFPPTTTGPATPAPYKYQSFWRSEQGWALPIKHTSQMASAPDSLVWLFDTMVPPAT